MKFSSKNVWIQLHKAIFDGYPHTLCGFFWKTVLSVLLLLSCPLVLVGVVIMRVRSKDYDFDNVRAFCMMHIMAVTLSWLFGAIIAGKNNPFTWYYFFLGFLGLLTILLFIFTLLFIINRVDEYKEARRFSKPTKQKEPNIIWEAIKAIKGKVCPMIEITRD